MYKKNTKIVATLGPATDTLKDIENLIQAGMDIARLNFSHGSYEHHKKLIKHIKKAEKKSGKTIGIMQDLQGPKIRLGELPKEGIKLRANDEVFITTKKIIGEQNEKETVIPIQYSRITKDAKKDQTILIKDGLIELKIIAVSRGGLRSKVLIGGTVKTRNGVHLPNSAVSAQTITEKDKKDLSFGLKNDVDFIAMSFVKNKKDIENLRTLIKKKRGSAKIIAKVERHEAIDNLKEIIKAADGVMVARGDLGTDIPAEQVPIIQKRMIRLANKYGKPIITATQVLNSMVKKSRATRAEISDAANAVFDSTDAIMLSNETAVGKYPVKAVSTLSKVARVVEKEMQKHEELIEHPQNKRISAINASCLNACELAVDSNANYIAVYTEDGYTARHVAKHRLYIPIIVITPDKKTARELSLVWGINTVIVKKIPKKVNKADKVFEILKKEKILKKKEKVIVICNASTQESTISTFKL